MAGTTVIDQLIVKLGLDPRDFSKGEKQAAAETVKLEQQVKKSSEGMGRSVMGFTGKLLGIASAAVVVKKVLGAVSDLSVKVRQLGIDSDNFGIAASELHNFGKVAEMMGGRAEDVTKTIGGLTKAVFDLAYNGQISDSLIMLARLGVQFQDSAGNARDFKSIVMDTQNAIQGLMQRGTSRENAYQMLMQAGFDPGIANAILKGDVQSQLSRQEARRQVTPDLVKTATEWEQSATSRDQALEAAAMRGLPAQAAAGITANKGTEALANLAAGTSTLTGSTEAVREAVPLYDAAIRGTANVMEWAAKTLEDARKHAQGNISRKNIEGMLDAAADKYGIDRDVLRGIARTESNFNPNAEAVNKQGVTTGRGVMQLNPRFFPNAGQSVQGDIDTAAQHFAGLLDKFEGTEQERYVHALRAYHAGEKNYREGTNLGPVNEAYAGKVLAETGMALPTPGAQRGTTNNTDITFESVTINTPRTDGEGVAQEFTDATRRKLLAAHAETGMQ